MMTQDMLWDIDDALQSLADELGIAYPSACRNSLTTNKIQYLFKKQKSLSIVLKEEVLIRLKDMGFSVKTSIDRGYLSIIVQKK